MIRRDSYTFTGNENLPSESWIPYFSQSTVGNSYTILWNDTDDELMMSNTEYEFSTYQPFFNELFNGANVLSIGYGIGFINDEITRNKATMTVIELHPEVVALETRNIENITMIYADAYNCDYQKLFPTEKFDIILFDPSGYDNPNKNFPRNPLNEILTPDGIMMRWSHAGCHLI